MRAYTLATAVALASQGVHALSGQFSCLSMNVAGLPQILQDNEVPGDKATNAGIIGSKFAEYDYDVIHVQEVRISIPALSTQAPAQPLISPGLQLPRIHLRNR